VHGERLSPAAVLELQHGAGNASVSRHLATRPHAPDPPPAAPHPRLPEEPAHVAQALARTASERIARGGERCACGGMIGADGLCDRCRARAQAGVLARQPAETELPATEAAPSALPDSAAALALIQDFSSYSVDDRLGAIALIHEEFWVGPIDEQTLLRIWSSFDDLSAVASANIALFRESADRGAPLLNLPQVAALRDRFRDDVIGLARQHMVDNRAYITSQLERLGLDADGPDAEPGRREDELAAIQRDAENVSRAQEYQRAMRTLLVGYEYRDDHPGIGPSLNPVPAFFDPEHAPLMGPNGDEQPALASWEATKLNYDRMTALVAGVANANPAIFATLRDGTTANLASEDPNQALMTVHTALSKVLADIDATGPKVGGVLDYRDLKPIHEQLFGGARAVSGENWSTGLAQWVGEDVVRDHEATEFWITLGLSSLGAAAFIVATLATAGSATFFIAAGVGAGIGAGMAAHSWEQYLTLAQAARTNVRDDLGLLGAGQASAALVTAVLDTAFVFLDVFGAAARLARVGGQAGKVLTKEAAEQAERQVAELAEREAAQQTEREAAEQAAERVGSAAGREGLEEGAEGVLHEAPVKVGEARHTLKIMQIGERIRVWLCTDCATLIDRVTEAINALPAGPEHEALRVELREIEAAAQRFEAQFLGQSRPQIGLSRLNRETDALASRLSDLSRLHPDIEALIFFRTFMADAEGAAQILGATLARRLEQELGREGLVGLMRDIGPKAVLNLSDLPGPEIAAMLRNLQVTLADDAKVVVRWIGETQTGAQARRLLADVPATALQKVVMVHARNRIEAAALRGIVDRLGSGTIPQLEQMLGQAFHGGRLKELAELDMFVLDPALQAFVDAGSGKVARSLGALGNRTVADIEVELVNAAMQGPRVERGMRIWTHADGSVVRIKVGAEALRGPTTTPHMVREIADQGHAYGVRDIIAKVTEDGTPVAAGTNFARQALSDWLRGAIGRVATDPELEILMGIWGRAGHVPVIP
jgi:hypothetical protein